MEEMQAQGIEWDEHYRHAAGAALKDVLEGRLAAGIDRHLEDMAAHAVPTGATAATGVAPGLNPGVGEIELGVPRTRTYSALEVVRAAHVDRLERMRSRLACFVLGLATARWPSRWRRSSAGGSARRGHRSERSGVRLAASRTRSSTVFMMARPLLA